MASLSAVRSPSVLSQQHHSPQRSFTISALSPPVGFQQNLFAEERQRNHQHQCGSSSCYSVGDNDESNENVKNSGALFLANAGFGHSRNKVYYDSDFSCPTSWEFRDNCSHLPRHLLAAGVQMPAASSSPVVLPLPLGEIGAAVLNSSATSSLATTPSPLDELSPYQVQMQFSMLRGNASNCQSIVPLPTSSACVSPLSVVRNCSDAVVGGSGVNCACVFVNSPANHSNQHQRSGMELANRTGPDGAYLHLHDKSSASNSGDGSDGSRNSTGSHRSQDSGFSDSGETRRRKSSASTNTFTGNQPDSFHHLPAASPTALVAGQSHLLFANSMTAALPCACPAPGYETNCCADRSLTSPSSVVATHAANGDYSSLPQIYHNSPAIYECAQSCMPSPIPSSGYGCGKLGSGSSALTSVTQHYPIYGVARAGSTPPRRPASVDISLLDRNGNCNGAPSSIMSRLSPLPSPVATSCSSCLPSSTAHRRSFSPSSKTHQYPSHSHDISALACASTATAIAALRVPLSSSTPKRLGSASTSRLNTHAVLKIDNFESLNKNVNKDNNNNSSSNSSAGAKTGNKTFTVQHLGRTNSGNDSILLPPSEYRQNCVPRNGTAFAEAEPRHDVSRGESEPEHESALPAGKRLGRTRTAAESIYDKICNRLSSFSGSSLSSSSQTNQTVVSVKGKSASLKVSSSHDQGGEDQENAENCQNSSQQSKSSLGEERTQSCSTSGKFKLFARSNSAKWQSLPRGVSPLQLPEPKEHCWNGASTTQPEISREAEASAPKSSCNLKRNALKEVEEKTESKTVRLWLHDLRTQTEPECLHSLQTKWILPGISLHDDDGDDEGTEITSRGSSRSPATSSTLTSTVTTTGSVTSSTEGCGRTCSSSSSNYPPSSPTEMDSESASSASSRKYIKQGHIATPGPGRTRHQQRISQQKFLSSMTAAIHAVSTPLMSIRNVEMTANVISGEFSKICKHLEFGVFTQVPTLVLSLIGHIDDFLHGVDGQVRTVGGAGNGLSVHLRKLESRLEHACYALEMVAKAMSEAAMIMNGSDSSDAGADGSSGKGSIPYQSQVPPRSSSTSPLSSSSSCTSSSNRESGGSDSYQNGLILSSSPSDPEPESLDRQYHVVVREAVDGIVTVGNLFSQVVDLRLTRDLASIIDTIEGGGIPARIALKSLATVLAEGGNHICRLAADIRTVRGLLGVLLDTREDQDKILALRCLATVLCVGEAVKDFDKAGGFEIIADLLYEPIYSKWIKMEAVAVLTQATDPWIDLETTLLTLGVHLEKFIASLTALIAEFKTEEEPFLLIVAAISNLTFLEVASTEYLKRCKSVPYLISAVKGNPNFSVFILDHVATILANMAGTESCRQEIIKCGGIDALLQFLQLRPSLPGKTDTVSAITACERLQQKSTIAISRLANEDGVAVHIFNMGGVHRLVTLCRKEKERNYSDGVLIAALATLRKLVTICGDDAVQRLGGAQDLIEPRLLDSFLLYSSRQESYV